MNNGKDIRPDQNLRGEAREVASVLAHASDPPLPEGAMDRLMARIADEPQQQRSVIPLRPVQPRRSIFRYAAAVPLAASLALGVYLGARGTFDFMLPPAITGGVALNDDAPDELGGVGEADAYAEETLS